MSLETGSVIALLLVLLIIGVPIAVSLGLAAAVGLWLLDFPLLIVIQRMVAGTESFALLAIPFFILSGAIMESGGLSRRLVNFADASVGFLPGGLANANIAASMVFGGISGSSVADASAVGSVMIPQMEKQGYSQVYSAAVTASASPVGMIIPPSIPMIVWSFVSGQSLNELFLAGIVPGILIGLVLMAISTFLCIRNGFQPHFGHFSLTRLGRGTWDGLLALGAPIIIIGGIVSGFFTPTEASVVSIFYALIVTMGVYRELPLRQLVKILISAGRMSASIMFVVCAATAFSFFITTAGLPKFVSGLFLDYASTPQLFILAASFILFIAGMFLDTTTTILMLGPILYPLIITFGIDPLVATMVMLIVLAVGLVTPPVGLCLFVVATLVPVKIMDVARVSIPFIIGMLGVAAFVWVVPATVTWVRP
jgi:C4-dicarboxylate transporter DctM subunit